MKIINKSTNPLPKYETPGSSGMDLMSNEDKNILPLSRALIKTGLFLELNRGLEAQIRPRSGLALKKGLTVLNTPGTIDSDYRGEIGVILYNTGNIEVEIKKGMRIAQMVIAGVERVDIEEVKEVNETIRGEGGFGHTGV